jgi:hypothetical protein
MSSYAMFVKNKLTSTIEMMAEKKDDFVKDSDKDFVRTRKLSFETVVKMLLSIGSGSLNKELLEYFNYDLESASSSAFVQQRKKLLPETFQFLLNEFTHSFNDYKTYEGYRLVAIDGSDLIAPYNPNDVDTYFQTSPDSKGYNLLHLNVLYDLCNKLYLDVRLQPGQKQSEHRALIDMVDHSLLEGKVIVIADRGYEGYNIFAHIEQNGWKYIVRVKEAESSGILSGLKLPDTEEYDLQVHKLLTRKQTNEVKIHPDIYRFLPKNTAFDYLDASEQLYYPMSFRVVRVKIDDDTYQCIITNLSAEEFSSEKIKTLYHMRWGVETSFRELKYTIGLSHFHSKKVEFVAQEVFARMVIYNFCEIITLHVVIQQKPRKHGYQVNFSMAMHICRQFFKTLDHVHPPNVEALIQKFLLPIRENRKHPRKIKAKTYVSFNYRVA